MNHTSHPIIYKIPAIQNIANAADTLVMEYKEAGFMPDIPGINPDELMTVAQHERLTALAIRNVLRASTI
jgi:hypothetical protein